MAAFQLSHLLHQYCTHDESPAGSESDDQARPRFRRVHLMRHSFRDAKAQLRKLRDWANLERVPTVEEAYPSDRPAAVSAAKVLNSVRFNPVLAELVTAEQGSDNLDVGDLVLVFASTGGKTAEYLGAYEVQEAAPDRKHMTWGDFESRYGDVLRDPSPALYALGFPEESKVVEGMGYNSLPSGGTGGYLYNLKRRSEVLEGLERRLIVEWKAGIRWHQQDLRKAVLEIRPPGFVREFTGYLNFTLSFEELRAIVGVEPTEDTSGSTPNLSKEKKALAVRGDPVWCERLAAVAGVYLVQSAEGHVYVGSASGKTTDGGFLGRWRTYAATNETWSGPDDKTGLRGNVGMKEFLDAEGDLALQRRRLHGLRFSIAREMPKNAVRRDVEDMERWFKDKLGSREIGAKLNRN